MATKRKLPNPVDVIVGANLRRLRVLKGLSQEDLGQKNVTPITFQQIQKYEKGINRISASRMVELCQVLGASVQDLMRGVAEDLPTHEIFERREERRGDLVAMREYRSLPVGIQNALRVLMCALVKELGNTKRCVP